MPTNIVQASGKPVGESGWSTIGQGAQGLAQLVGGLMSAQAANKATKAPVPGALPTNMDLGPGAAIPEMDPNILRGAGSGNLGMPSMPSRPIDGRVQPFSSAPRGEFMNVGPSSQPSDLMGSLQMPGIARTFSPIQTMMTRNFPAGTFQYGGL